MSSPDEFSEKLYVAAEQKVLWFDSVALPKVLEEYRNYRSVIENIISLLLNKGLILSDPYKHEKKIVDITIPDTGDFKELESATVLGTRLSEYESTLDFMSNYTRFTVESLSLDRIKKLVQLNSFIQWASLYNITNRGNSRGLGVFFSSIKQSGDALSVGLINNMVSVSAKSIVFINEELKVLVEIQKELYKIEVRKIVLDDVSFASERKSLTMENGVSKIKRGFHSRMGKKTFYTELIEEILQEEVGADKETRRQVLINKFGILTQAKEKKVIEVGKKSLILDAVRAFGAFSSQFDVVVQKINENHTLFQSEHNTTWGKIIAVFRKTFGLNEKSIEYKIKILESRTQVTRTEALDYSEFIDTLAQRSRLYANISSKTSLSYQKIEQQSDEAIFEYVQKIITECQSFYVTLVGLDEFFKTEVSPANRSRVKGLLMELTAIKNSLVVVNQRKVEYVSIIAEQEQLKRLGIINE